MMCFRVVASAFHAGENYRVVVTEFISCCDSFVCVRICSCCVCVHVSVVACSFTYVVVFGVVSFVVFVRM